MPTLPAWPRVTTSRTRIGMSKWDLETPALCVDLDALETNIARMQAFAEQHGIALRPHAKTHKCADDRRAATGGGRDRHLRREAG